MDHFLLDKRTGSTAHAECFLNDVKLQAAHHETYSGKEFTYPQYSNLHSSATLWFTVWISTASC